MISFLIFLKTNSKALSIWYPYTFNMYILVGKNQKKYILYGRQKKTFLLNM